MMDSLLKYTLVSMIDMQLILTLMNRPMNFLNRTGWLVQRAAVIGKHELVEFRPKKIIDKVALPFISLVHCLVLEY